MAKTRVLASASFVFNQSERARGGFRCAKNLLACAAARLQQQTAPSPASNRALGPPRYAPGASPCHSVPLLAAALAGCDGRMHPDACLPRQCHSNVKTLPLPQRPAAPSRPGPAAAAAHALEAKVAAAGSAAAAPPTLLRNLHTHRRRSRRSRRRRRRRRPSRAAAVLPTGPRHQEAGLRPSAAGPGLGHQRHQRHQRPVGQRPRLGLVRPPRPTQGGRAPLLPCRRTRAHPSLLRAAPALPAEQEAPLRAARRAAMGTREALVVWASRASSTTSSCRCG